MWGLLGAILGFSGCFGGATESGPVLGSGGSGSVEAGAAGDGMSHVEAGASADGSVPLDATTPVEASVLDASAPFDGDASQLPTSCADLQAQDPTATTGVYTLLLGGSVRNAFCDMDLAEGGWTVFFAGTNGSPNVFDHFEVATDDCSDPAAHCLRRVPASVTTATTFAASCGTAAVTFNVNDLALAYFQSGTQNQWQPLGNATTVAGGAVATYATQVWTGQADNQGWILSNNDLSPGATAHTFAQSYDWNDTWDYCNGQPDQGSLVRLMYR